MAEQHQEVPEEETYIVQVFATFAPAEARPLLVRLDPEDKVSDLVNKTLTKFQELQTIVVLPAENQEEYAVSAAGGDGLPLATVPPFRQDTIVRSCGLEFPYMLSLNHLQELEYFHSSTNTSNAQQQNSGVRGAVQGGNNSSSATLGNKSGAVDRAGHLGSALLSAERDVRAAHQAKITEVREQRVKEIERRQSEKEKRHFQHCETYELYRQETQAKELQNKKESQQKAETQAQAKSLREEVAAERHQPKEQQLLEQHRQRMEAQLAADKERLEQMRRQQEEQAKLQESRKKQAAKELAEKRKAEQGERLNGLFDRLMDNLSTRMTNDQSQEEAMIEAERQERRDEERRVMELRRVEHLERTRTISKDNERAKRCQEERAFAERTLLLEQTRMEEEEAARKEEEEAYQAWKKRRDLSMQGVESELELHYRSQSQSQNSSAVKH